MAVSVTVKLTVTEFDDLREALRQFADSMKKQRDAAADRGDTAMRGRLYSRINYVEHLLEVLK